MLADRIRLGSGKRGQPLSNLAVGDKIKFGRYQVASEVAQEIIWVIAAKNHVCIPSYPANSVTLITEKIIDLRCFDAKEPSNSDSERQQYGNNRYSMSNIDQWLNKDSTAGAWYVAAHVADQAPNLANVDSNTPYNTKAGFLNLFTSKEKNIIQNTTIRVVKSLVDGAGYEDITRKIYLPSTTEIGLANENSIAEGAKWSFFNTEGKIAYLTQQAFENTPASNKPTVIETQWYWWLRTPSYTTSNTVHFEYGNGLYQQAAYYGYFGLRPACNLPSTISISNDVDADGCYTLV